MSEISPRSGSPSLSHSSGTSWSQQLSQGSSVPAEGMGWGQLDGRVEEQGTSKEGKRAALPPVSCLKEPLAARVWPCHVGDPVPGWHGVPEGSRCK